MDNINLKNDIVSSGLLYFKVCINIMIELFYTKYDCIYTFITVSIEDTIQMKIENPKYVFLFKLSSKMNTDLAISSDLTFTFLESCSHINSNLLNTTTLKYNPSGIVILLLTNTVQMKMITSTI